MSSIFSNGGALAEPMQRLLYVLNDSGQSHIVLVEADDEVVRQEAMAELGERLSEKYRIAEFNYANPPLPSLMRYYRQLCVKTPVCLFAHGTEILKARHPEEYSDALHFLNAHREDIRLAPGAVVLWLPTSTWKDVLTEAPDFADWQTGGGHLRPPRWRTDRAHRSRPALDLRGRGDASRGATLPGDAVAAESRAAAQG